MTDTVVELPIQKTISQTKAKKAVRAAVVALDDVRDRLSVRRTPNGVFFRNNRRGAETPSPMTFA